MNNSHSNKIIQRSDGDYNLFIKDDGYDYARVWHDFLAGKIPGLKTLRYVPPHMPRPREAYYAEVNGREFLIKIEYKEIKRLEMKIRRFIFGPVHSRRMKAVNKAINAGCTCTQDIYFVAEQKGILAKKAYMIIEWLPGRSLYEEPDYSIYHQDMIKALVELHSYKLTLSDLAANNFLITDKGMKIIDISTRFTAWAEIGKDILYAKIHYGIDVPARNFSEKAALIYFYAKHWRRKLWDKIRSPLKKKGGA